MEKEIQVRFLAKSYNPALEFMELEGSLSLHLHKPY
jgi:hypothetical protein